MPNPEILGERRFETPAERAELHGELEGTALEKLKIPAEQHPEWKRLAKGLCVDPVTAPPDRVTPGVTELRRLHVKVETDRRLAMQAISVMLTQLKDETDATRIASFASAVRVQMEDFDAEAYAYETQALAVDIEDAGLQNLTPAEIAALKTLLPRSPKEPKKDCPAEQRRAFETAKTTWDALQAKAGDIFALLRQGKKADADAIAKDLKPLLAAYPAQIEAYETEARKTGLTVFKNAMGLQEVSDDDFRELLADLRSPLTPPERAADQSNVASLRQMHPEIEKLRTDLSRDIDKRLLSLGQAGNQENLDVEMAFWKEDVVALMLHRHHYEKLAGLDTKKSSKYIQFLTMAGSEAIEELMEGLKFGERPWRYRWKTMENVDIATRDAFVRAGDQVTKMFAKSGIKCPPRVLRILAAMAESPLGGQLLKSMIKFESPVTVVLFAMYLHQTDNKIKAAVDWAGFMVTSHLSGEILVIADKILLGRNAVKAGSKVLAHPVLKFTAALLLIFGFQKEFNQLTSWVDRQIPESRLKHSAGLAISTVFGDSLITHGEIWLQDAGVIKVSPQTEQKKYLMNTRIQGGEYVVDLDSRMNRTLKDWNAAVDVAIRDAKNPVQKRLWELEKVTDPIAWSKREAAHLFPAVVNFKTLETDLNANLKAKGKDFPPLDLVETVISDNSDAPNDRAFARVLENHRGIDDYMRTLDEKDPLRESWNVYRSRGNTIAKTVRLYRHLTKPEHDAVGNLGEISYNRQQWLGDLKSIPPFVQEGLREEMLYQLRRKEAVRLRPGEKASDLVDAAEGVEAAKWDVGSIFKDILDLDKFLELLCDRTKAEYNERLAQQALLARNDLKQLTGKLDPYLKRAETDPGMADRLRPILLPLRNLALRRHVNHQETMTEMERVMRLVAAGIAQLALGDASSAAEMDAGLRERMGFTGSENFAGTTLLVGPEVDDLSKDVAIRGMSGWVKHYRTTMDWNGGEMPQGACPFRDIIIIDSTPPPRARVVTMTSFRCTGTDRKRWAVKTETVQETIQARGTGLRYGETVVQSYEAWYKQMETAAPRRLRSLEPVFLRMEERRRQEARDAETRAATLKREQDEAVKRGAVTTDKWVDLKDGRYRMRYVDETTGQEHVLTVPSYRNSPPGISAIPEPGIIQRNGAFEFTEEGTGKKHAITRDTFNTPSPEAAMLRTVLTTPIEGDDEGSLYRIIRLFPYELTRNKQYMDNALRDELLPLYRSAWAKRQFLNELFALLCQKGTVTEANKNEIVKWFRDRPAMFAQPKALDRDATVFPRRLPYPVTLNQLEASAAPDLVQGYPLLQQRHRPLAAARAPLEERFRALHAKEYQPGEMAQLRREAAALAPAEERYVRDCDAYNARYEMLRAKSVRNHAILARTSASMAASHSKEWSDKLTPSPAKHVKFVMIGTSIRESNAKDKRVMDGIIAVANANEYHIRVIKCVHVTKEELPGGALRYHATYIMDNHNGGWRYIFQCIDWVKDAPAPEAGLPSYVDHTLEKQTEEWMGPNVREMDRIAGEWEKNKDKDRILRNGTLKERLELAARTHNEFILLGDAGGYKFHGVNHDGNLLVVREQNGFMQHVTVPLAQPGQGGQGGANDGQATVRAVEQIMGGQGGEWATFQPATNQGLQMQARAGAPPTPDQIIARKVLVLRRQGESSDESVRRVMRNYQPKPGDLFNENSERDMAFLYSNIVAGNGDRESTEQMREKFLSDLFDSSARADTGQGLGRAEQQQLEAEMRGKISSGSYGQNAQQYSGMRSAPSYVQISPGAGRLSPGMGR
jgi:hypothetical protein